MQSANNKRDNIFNHSNYAFFADTRTKIFHTASCPDITGIALKYIQGCGKKPEKSGFHPCPRCVPKSAQFSRPLPPKPYTRSPVPKRSKAEIMREQLLRVADTYGIHLCFVGQIAHIMTLAGEWYFDINDRPITLHHKNAEERYDRQGQLISHYHIQRNVKINSPLHALAYIFRHEAAEEVRLLAEIHKHKSTPPEFPTKRRRSTQNNRSIFIFRQRKSYGNRTSFIP